VAPEGKDQSIIELSTDKQAYTQSSFIMTPLASAPQAPPKCSHVKINFFVFVLFHNLVFLLYNILCCFLDFLFNTKKYKKEEEKKREKLALLYVFLRNKKPWVKFLVLSSIMK
jgi:hypothetical protein